HSPQVRSFTADPHTGIVGEPEGVIQNLVDSRARPAQDAMLALARERPDRVLDDIRALAAPRHHDVRAQDVDLTRLGAVLAVAYERDLRDFASLLLVEKLGARTLQSLALVAEVIHGTPTRFSDPARFSFAHGGKDGHPFPVPVKTYDESLSILRRSLDQAKVEHSEKLEGFRRLDGFVRMIEQQRAPEANFGNVIAHERAISGSLDGRTVFDKSKQVPEKQLKLFPHT